MKYHVLSLYSVIAFMVMASFTSCKSKDGQSKRQHLNGEFIFTDKSDLEISYAHTNVSFEPAVHERDGSADLIKLRLFITTDNLEMNIFLSEPITPPENGIVINKTYIIGEINNDLESPNILSLKLNEGLSGEYEASDGTITFKYETGITQGTFDVNIIESTEIGQSNSETKHISGTFKTDVVIFDCYTLENTEVNNTTMASDVDDSGTVPELPPNTTYMASLDHPFCKQYL